MSSQSNGVSGPHTSGSQAQVPATFGQVTPIATHEEFNARRAENPRSLAFRVPRGTHLNLIENILPGIARAQQVSIYVFLMAQSEFVTARWEPAKGFQRRQHATEAYADFDEFVAKITALLEALKETIPTFTYKVEAMSDRNLFITFQALPDDVSQKLRQDIAQIEEKSKYKSDTGKGSRTFKSNPWRLRATGPNLDTVPMSHAFIYNNHDQPLTADPDARSKVMQVTTAIREALLKLANPGLPGQATTPPSDQPDGLLKIVGSTMVPSAIDPDGSFYTHPAATDMFGTPNPLVYELREIRPGVTALVIRTFSEPYYANEHRGVSAVELIIYHDLNPSDPQSRDKKLCIEWRWRTYTLTYTSHPAPGTEAIRAIPMPLPPTGDNDMVELNQTKVRIEGDGWLSTSNREKNAHKAMSMSKLMRERLAASMRQHFFSRHVQDAIRINGTEGWLDSDLDAEIVTEDEGKEGTDDNPAAPQPAPEVPKTDEAEVPAEVG